MAIGVADRSKTVEAMMAASQRAADIIKGGDNMRAKGKAYLPKFPSEKEDEYAARLKNSWLFNGVGKAAEDISGRIFSKPIVLADSDSPLQEWCTNIDMEGRDLSNFAKTVFDASLPRGISFIMADAPPKQQNQTVGEVQASGWRPFLVSLPLESVLGWKWEYVNNAPVITQFRIMESVADPNRGEFSDEMVDQVRVLDLIGGVVQVSLYRTDDKGKWGLVADGQYSTEFDQIYVVPVYTGRTGFLTSKTPLDELAELNLAHWRIQSDKSDCLHKSLAPLLFLKQMGEIGDGGSIVINSSGYGYAAQADGADMKWIELSGSGIALGSVELKEIQDQMKQMGLQIIEQRVGVTTATGDSINEGKSVSRIRMWADELKDSLEIALAWMADIAGIELGDNQGDVIVNKDFGLMGGMALADIKDMYLAGVISRATYIDEARRRGLIDEAITADDEAERIIDEGLSAEQ